GDEGVPHPGAVVARVRVRLAGLGIGGRLGAGERQQGGLDEGPVLGRAPAADPDPASAVFGDRQVPVQVGGSLFALELGFEPSVDGVGVDDLGDVPAGFGELGGVQVAGLADQDLLPAAADQVAGRQ